MKLFALAALAALMAGCGGGGSAPPAPTAVAAPAAPAVPVCTPHAVTVLLDGDSTNWGFLSGSAGLRSSVYPELALQALLDAKYGSGAVTVRTGAVSGTVSNQWAAQPNDADFVFYNFGINDAVFSNPEATYKANLQAMYAAAPGRVVFQTPLPYFDATSTLPHVGYAQDMRDVAASLGAPVADSSAWAMAQPDWRTRVPDGKHPNDATYLDIAADVLLPALVPLVNPARCVS